MDGRFFEIDARLTNLREKQHRLPTQIVAEFGRRLEISWIYHDCALEGVLLSYSEIKAAIDRNIISDVSLIPSYEELKAFKGAIDFAYDTADNKKKPINLETIRKIYSLLAPDEVDKGIPFRKDNPLHRLYYHEISQHDKIAYRMRKLGEWLEEDSARRLHPIERAARVHFKLMNIYPWTRNSGRVARVL
jgi:Fic family protein